MRVKDSLDDYWEDNKKGDVISPFSIKGGKMKDNNLLKSLLQSGINPDEKLMNNQNQYQQNQYQQNQFMENQFTEEQSNDSETETEYVNKIRRTVTERFGEKLITLSGDISFNHEVRTFIKEIVTKKYYGNSIKISNTTEYIFNDIIGLGPLQPLLENPDITEIMVTKYDLVYVEKKGIMQLVDNIKFESNEHLYNTIQKIVSPMGRKIDEAEPLVDTSLPDGSRVNATVPPATPDGPTLTIRKFSENKLTPQDYLNFGSLSIDMIEFLKLAIKGKANIIVAGGTGTGKTSLLNMISQFIGGSDAITTIEDTLELQLQQDNVRRLLARKAVNGKGEIPIRRLVKNTLRMRPDRILVGEIRGGEIYDMLDSMSSGHEGGMGTIHSKSPKHLVDIRIPILMAMSDISINETAQRKMISDAIDLIIYIKRFKDGSRKITNITEVVGYGLEGASKLKIKNADPDKIYLNDIYRFKEGGYVGGKMRGDYVTTGYVPKRILEKASIYDVDIDENIFLEK